MAIQTPFHAESFGPPRQRHLIDPTVTGFAAHSLVNMNAVIEIDEIRHVVHAYPFDRPVFTEACANRLERGTVRPNLLVAVHTHFRGGYSGKGNLLDGRVAITAVDADAGDVVLVAEWHGLLAYNVLAGHVGRTNNAGPGGRYNHNHEDSTEDC